jgi:hypothetical protein
MFDIARFNRRLVVEKHDLLRKTTLAAYQGMVTTTRVDTGRARANYNVTLSNPNSETREKAGTAPTKGTPPTAEEQRGSGIVRTTMEIKSGRFDNVWIANGLPYVSILDERYDMTGTVLRELKRKLESGAMA